MGSKIIKRYSLLGTPLLVTTYEDFASYCRKACRADAPLAVDFSNTQIVTMRRHDPAFRKVTGCFDYFIPDGMPLVWCLNRAGAGMSDRVYGPTFMRHCLATSSASVRHYLLGGSQECLDRLKSNLLEQNPDLQIAGSHHGYFSEDDEETILAEINRISPDFVWIGLGTPKQQAWIYRNKERIRRGVILAVGFAFDVNAGTKTDAPVWMQRRGLTWLYRMVREPRRLAARYLRYNALFLGYLLWDTLRGRALQIVAENETHYGTAKRTKER